MTAIGGGIGFLGAGAIIGGMSGNKIRGVATGAAIWVAGAIVRPAGLASIERLSM